MAKVNNPVTLASAFGVELEQLNELGVLNATLAIDTKLFIDPLLLAESRHPEISNGAATEYRSHFEMVIKFLAASRAPGDVPWRSAERLLVFHEIPETCLGYGASSIRGSGFGRGLSDHLLQTAKEIVDLGITDPDLFIAMALFEDDIGPDRISDMTTNVIFGSLGAFNDRIVNLLGLKTEEFISHGKHGHFLRNPTQSRKTPLILIPQDILRELPIATDWDGVEDAASKNETVRHEVNEHIAHIWEAKTRRSKALLRVEALSERAAFSALLDAMHGVPRDSYDSVKDTNGLVRWAHAAEAIARKYPLQILTTSEPGTVEYVYEVVLKIVAQFRHLIENSGLNRELYKETGVPRHESTSQRLFFAVAYSYCKANNIDISPEIDTGSGAVDFKLSSGFEARTLVEVKLSSNPKVVHGYETQLEVYRVAQETMRAIYLVIDVGQMGRKQERLIEVRNTAIKNGNPLSDLEFVDGLLRPTASKR